MTTTFAPTQSALAFDAMAFAMYKHGGQQRRYTDEPYAQHLAEVAGIMAASMKVQYNPNVVIAVAWLHNIMEDQGVTGAELEERFGYQVARGVAYLSDLEKGNRSERKALARARLSSAPGWVQTIKVADIISNTPSIARNDPKFAPVYLAEVRQLLEVLIEADEGLLVVARAQLARYTGAAEVRG